MSVESFECYSSRSSSGASIKAREAQQTVYKTRVIEKRHPFSDYRGLHGPTQNWASTLRSPVRLQTWTVRKVKPLRKKRIQAASTTSEDTSRSSPVFSDRSEQFRTDRFEQLQRLREFMRESMRESMRKFMQALEAVRGRKQAEREQEQAERELPSTSEFIPVTSEDTSRSSPAPSDRSEQFRTDRFEQLQRLRESMRESMQVLEAVRGRKQAEREQEQAERELPSTSEFIPATEEEENPLLAYLGIKSELDTSSEAGTVMSSLPSWIQGATEEMQEYRDPTEERRELDEASVSKAVTPLHSPRAPSITLSQALSIHDSVSSLELSPRVSLARTRQLQKRYYELLNRLASLVLVARHQQILMDPDFESEEPLLDLYSGMDLSLHRQSARVRDFIERVQGSKSDYDRKLQSMKRSNSFASLQKFRAEISKIGEQVEQKRFRKEQLKYEKQLKVLALPDEPKEIETNPKRLFKIGLSQMPKPFRSELKRLLTFPSSERVLERAQSLVSSKDPSQPEQYENGDYVRKFDVRDNVEDLEEKVETLERQIRVLQEGRPVYTSLSSITEDIQEVSREFREAEILLKESGVDLSHAERAIAGRDQEESRLYEIERDWERYAREIERASGYLHGIRTEATRNHQAVTEIMRIICDPSDPRSMLDSAHEKILKQALLHYAAS